MSELLTSVEKYGSLTAKLIVALGVCITWGYCAFIINFFPTGLTVADSLVFIFIALGFGILYVYWLLFGFLGAYFFVSFFQEPHIRARLFSAVMFLVFAGCLVFLACIMKDASSLLAPLFSGALLYLTIIHWKPDVARATIKQRRERARMRIMIFFTALFLPLTVAVPVIGIIIDSSFGLIGITQKNVSLAVSEDNQKIINDVAKEFDISVYGCSENGKKTNIVHHFNVLWHGLGERSLVELLTHDGNGWKPKARIELDRSGLKILKPTNKETTFNTCLTLNSDTLFGTYEDNISKYGKLQLKVFSDETKNKLNADHLQILSAKIIGYTDRVPVSKNSDSNFDLSIRRANSVHTELKEYGLLTDIPESEIKSSGQGSLLSKSNCSRELNPAELKECLAVDRRVEIELKLQMKPTEKQTSTDPAPQKDMSVCDFVFCKIGLKKCPDKVPATMAPSDN
ncbi:OmpA family protein [Pseudomonas sp. MG-9]|uniref:OmpA family protein n=1 Tax=Pseudomonas sp. MG-9 TaxID=2839032 RepID=UPI001C004076|nr:OmpA family protein [Pseudomonas sp. MG-9]MBT9265259.1 OmpA family protein [Pseudomonas sp. MG-9]